MLFQADSLSPPRLQHQNHFKRSPRASPTSNTATNSVNPRRISLTAVLLFALALLFVVGLFVLFHVILPLSATPSERQNSTKSSSHSVPRKKAATRLPTDNSPILYDITIKVFLPYHDGLDYGRRNNTIAGSAKIRFRCETKNAMIVFHVKDLAVHNESVRVFDAVRRNAVDVVAVARSEAEWIEIHTSQNLRPRGEYLVLFDYTARVGGSQQGGLYRSPYLRDGERRWMATTQMQTHDARRLLPCMDEPAMKARFLLTIIHPLGTTAISNAEANRTEALSREWQKTEFRETPKMSTYLLAVAISDCPFRETFLNNIRIRVWIEPAKINDTEFVLEIAPKLLAYYESYFVIPYPLSKLDVFAVPQLRVLAMENWGLIFCRQVHIVYREGLSNTNKEKITEVLAHEIAHMWYGNLVTMKWWNDLWLNEGFATYIGMKAADAIENSTTREDQLFMLDISGQSLRREEVNVFNTHELSPESLAGLSIQEMFSVITYNKAASVIKMVEKIVGPSSFRRALQLYLNRFAYANAAREDLFEVLNEAMVGVNGSHSFSDGRFSLAQFMNGWTHQRGFPLIQIHRLPSGDLTADQALLWFNWDQIKTPYDSLQWKVPIFLSNSSFIWLEENATVLLPPTVPFDPHGLGYYRINYDPISWEGMISALIADYNVYGIASRSRLLEDAFRIAFCGKLAFSVPIRLSQYLMNEGLNLATPLLVEYAPFRIYAANFDFLSLLLHSIPGFHKLQGYFMDLLKPAFHRLINDSTVDGNHMKEALRDIVFVKLCSVNYPPCIARLLPMFHEVRRRCESRPLSDFTCNSIHPTLRKAVYMTTVQFGSPADYRFLLQKYREETYSSERERIFGSLIVGRHAEDIERFFNETFLQNDLNNFVYRSVMSMLLKGRPFWDDTFFEYLTKFHVELLHKYRTHPQILGTIVIQSANMKYRTHEELVKFDTLITLFAKVIPPNYRSIRHGILKRAQWIDSHAGDIMALFGADASQLHDP